MSPRRFVPVLALARSLRRSRGAARGFPNPGTCRGATRSSRSHRAADPTRAGVELLEPRALLATTSMATVGMPLLPEDLVAPTATLADTRLQPASTVISLSVPGSPTGLSGVPLNARVRLTWSAPAWNGGAKISDYVIQHSSDAGTTWTTFADRVSATTSATVTGLTNGRSYLFRVAAVNAAGTGTSLPTSAALTPRTVPRPPRGVVGVPGNARVKLTWSAPAWNGGAKISDYVIQHSSDAGTTWTTFADRVSATTSATVTGLTNGRSYLFRVAAVNAAGVSLPSAASSAVAPRRVPGVPTGLAGSPGDGRVTLAWSAPAKDAVAAITDYRVDISSDAGITWTTFADGVSPATGATVTGLANGTGYVFRVAAVNRAGPSAVSGASAVITPSAPAPRLDIPRMPTGLAVSSRHESGVTLSWDDVSGASDYRIERSSDYADYVSWGQGEHATWTFVGASGADTTSFTDSGVEEVTSYSYRVIATNVLGSSAPSDTVMTTTKALAPSDVVATAVHGGRIELNWTDRSSREWHYGVEQFFPATNTWAGVSGTPLDSTGMIVGGRFLPSTTYEFRVRAVAGSQWHGLGGSSDDVLVSVTTPAYPHHPTGPAVMTASDSTVTLSWDDVSDASGYRIERNSHYGEWYGAWTEVGRVAAGITSFSDTGLEEGSRYSYRVVAVNAAGASAPGDVVAATTKLHAPDDMVATVIDGGRIELSWADRSNREGHYGVEQFVPEWNTWTGVSGTPLDSTGMIVGGRFLPSTTYQFRVRAVAGELTYVRGEPSDDVLVSVTTPAYPGAPGGLTATAFSDSVRLSWEFRPDVAVVVERMARGGEWAVVAEITSAASSYDEHDLEPSTAYAYRLAFRNAHGTSGFSGVVSGHTAARPSVTAAYRSPSVVFVGWTSRLEGVTGVTIERAANGSEAWTAIAALGGNGTGYDDTAVVPGTSYRYRIIIERSVRPPVAATGAETGPGPRDSDTDGLTDGEELAVGTNPQAFSTDDDMLGDGFELANGLDAFSGDEDGNGVRDQHDDFDDDGLTNFQEMRLGTSTLRTDTDGDGIPDGVDTDGDGVSDCVEAAQGSDPTSHLDRGVPPEPEEKIRLALTVGDPSGSRSEQWGLRVGAILHASATHGEVGSGDYFFDAGKSYPIRLEHQGSSVLSATPAAVERIAKPAFSRTINVSAQTPFDPKHRPPPILERTIVIPDHVPLPVMLNISGYVNDDLLLDGQSITEELQIDGSYLDPGPYPDFIGYGYVGAHEIGSLPGPFQDTVNGGITFKWNKREFTVACRDTIGSGAGIDITIRVMEFPDYDWYANIEATDRSDFFVVDTNAPLHLVGPYQGDWMSEAGGGDFRSLEAALHVPRFDVDVDSKNDSGFSEPDDNREEDRLEHDPSTGKLVFVGADFVPMAVRLSNNVREAQPTSIQVFFDHDPTVFRLWKPGLDAGTARTPSDIIPARTWVSADEIGLEPGGDRTVFVEALKGTPRGGIPITTTVRVEGSRWSGTLTDTVHLLPVEVDLQVHEDTGILPQALEDGAGAVIWRNSDFSRKLPNPDTSRSEPGMPRYLPDHRDQTAIDPEYASQFTQAKAVFTGAMAEAFSFRFDVGDPSSVALWTRTEWTGFIPAADGWWRIPAGQEVRPAGGNATEIAFWIEGLAATGYARGSVAFRATADASLSRTRDSVSDAANYTVVDVGLGVDGNRDGTIDFSDSYDRQLTFWLNNDRETRDDGYEQENPSTSGPEDSADDRISQPRDLEDFAALRLLVDPVFQGKDSPFSRAGVGGSRPPSVRFNLTLGSKDAALRLFRAVDESANAHVKDIDIASRQTDWRFNYNAEDGLTTGVSRGEPALVGNLDLYSQFDENSQYRRPSFLFEALGKPATTTLTFTVTVTYPQPDGASGQPRTTTRTHTLDLDLREIKDFYTRMQVPYRIGGRDDRFAHFVAGTTELPHFAAAQPLFTGKTGDMPFLSGSDTVVLVHGWNNTDGTQTNGPPGDSKKASAETTFKRLYWQGFRGNFTAFDWPTFADQEGSLQGDLEVLNFTYNASEYQAFRSGRSLMTFLADKKATGPVHLLAHSMGNVVAAEALRQWTAAGNAQPLVTSYVAMQGALSAGAYGDDATDATGDDPSGYDYYRYWPDRWLGTERRYYMQGTDQAAGRWINMFNEVDRATSAVLGWVGNNRMKPRGGDIWTVQSATGSPTPQFIAYRIDRPDYGGRLLRSYVVNGLPSDEIDLKQWLVAPGPGQLPGPAAYEVLAFMSRASAKPIGTKVVRFFGTNIDISKLGLGEPYVRELSGHSFQFHFDAATTSQFWKRVMDETGMNTVRTRRAP